MNTATDVLSADSEIIASRKDRRKKILLNRTFRPHGFLSKQRTEWGGKELHTGTETTRHRCPGARYGKTGKGGSRRSEGIGLTHAHGEGGGVTHRYRSISAPVPGTVKLVRGEVVKLQMQRNHVFFHSPIHHDLPSPIQADTIQPGAVKLALRGHWST